MLLIEQQSHSIRIEIFLGFSIRNITQVRVGHCVLVGHSYRGILQEQQLGIEAIMRLSHSKKMGSRRHFRLAQLGLRVLGLQVAHCSQGNSMEKGTILESDQVL